MGLISWWLSQPIKVTHQPFGWGTSGCEYVEVFLRWFGFLSLRSPVWALSARPGGSEAEGSPGSFFEDFSLVIFFFHHFTSPSLLHLGLQGCIFLPWMWPMSCCLAGQSLAVWDGEGPGRWPLCWRTGQYPVVSPELHPVHWPCDSGLSLRVWRDQPTDHWYPLFRLQAVASSALLLSSLHWNLHLLLYYLFCFLF